MAESGVLLKRTTARKLYMTLPKADTGGELAPGNVVFFDNLKHCGIVESSSAFYHAQVSRGTNLSRFEPYWKPKVCGFRRMRAPGR
jgi:cell wall-associated NlpC family hydrolase